MHYSTLPVLALLCIVQLSSHAALPDVTSVLKQIHADQSAEKPDSQIEELIERVKLADEPDARIQEWIQLFNELTRPGHPLSGYQHRDELLSHFATLGKHFPEKKDWPLFKQKLDAAAAASPANPKLLDLQFIFAILQSDESTAIALFKAKMPASSKALGGIAGALGVADPFARQDRQWEKLQHLALQESSMPALQKMAVETWLNAADSSQNRYFRELPDLSLFYSGKELDAKLVKLCKAMKDRLAPSQLNKSLQRRAYEIIQAEGITPSQSWLQFFDAESDSYQSDLDYYLSKRTDDNSRYNIVRQQIQNLLKDNQVDEAWSQWQIFAQDNSTEAGRFILSLFGWQSRNYPQEAILEMAKRLLPLIDSPKLLKELSEVFPHNADEEDPILVRTAELRASLEDPLARLKLELIELDRYLAFNMIEQAIPTAESILSQSAQFAPLSKQRDGFNLDSTVGFAKAFRRLEHPEIARRWIDAAVESIAGVEEYRQASTMNRISRYYLDGGQPELAFSSAIDAIKYQKEIQKKQRNPYNARALDIAAQLSQLVFIYAQAGQHSDVLALLDRAEGWNASDLEDVRSYIPHSNLQTLTALALHHTGRSGQASQILRDYLRYYKNSSDPAYEALIEIEGRAAVPFLKTLEEEAPFEERPLIWQAVLEQQSGNLAEAEKLARAAIAIDPTDGEMDEFDRLRAYALLGEILAAQGSDEAELYADIVKAVDTAETGDSYRQAGLDSLALKYYTEAINLFKDAYCVRFRTAVELESAGRIEEAEANFEVAYSLMPDQFGRIESHCFGCEGAFRGERAGTIAERVFTRMLKERPDKPSLHYLMGYLKESQGEASEALGYFKRAVELDPLYYNAWKHIRDIASSPENRHPTLALQATVSMFEYAPRRSAGITRNLEIRELGLLWETLDQLYPILPPRESGMYPLQASAQAIKDSPQSSYRRNWRTNQWDITSPAEILFQQNDVTQLLMQD